MSSIHDQLVDLLHQVNRGMGKYARDVVAEHDIPFSMLMISKHIKAEPGITVSELARQTGIVKSHVSNQTKELEQRGWVTKESDSSDQRILRLYLTPAATKELGIIGQKIRKQFNAVVADIPETRAAELLADLEEIKQAIEKYHSQHQHICHKIGVDTLD